MKFATATMIFSLVLPALAPVNTQASGFNRMDAASPYLSTAGAGQATDTTVTAAFNNPAGLVGVKSTEFYSGAVVGNDSFTFHDDGSEGISPGFDNLRRDGVDYDTGWSGGAAFAFARPLNDRLTFGVALISPFGGAADFGEGWVGSHFTEEVEMLSIQASAALGFRLSDNWSVGATLGVQYLSWELNMDLPPAPFGPVNPGFITPDHPMYAELLPPGSEELIEIDDVELYWSLGVLWQPGENTLLGLRYIPEINHDLDGDAKIYAPIPEMDVVRTYSASMEMGTPSVTTLSLSHQLTPKWTLLADIEHSGWSVWKENRILHENGPTVVVERNWQDSMGYSVGFNFQATPRTLLKFGVGYDEAPMDESNLKVDPPMDRQIGYSIGFESRLTDKLRLTAAYQYMDMGDIRVEQTLFPGQVNRGYSEADCDVFHIGLEFGF
jgi:long-chain fatty acid transport protein